MQTTLVTPAADCCVTRNRQLRHVIILTMRPAAASLPRGHRTGTACSGERYVEQSSVGDDGCRPATVALGGKLQWWRVT